MIQRYEKYEIHLTDKGEMQEERKRLWKEGWVVCEETYYDIAYGGDKIDHVVFVLKAIRYKKRYAKEDDDE